MNRKSVMRFNKISLLILALLAPCALLAEGQQGVQSIKIDENTEDLQKRLSRLSESFLPRAGGDDVLSVDRKNNKVIISTMDVTNTLTVGGDTVIPVSYKVGTFTSLAFPNEGNVVVAGVGFEPRMIMLFMANSNARMSFGACTESGTFAGGTHEGTSSQFSATKCLIYTGGAPSATLASMDADGFTLTFSGTNAGFDSETIGYVAFR